MREETKAIRIQSERSSHQEHSVPLYLTSSFVFEDAEDMRAQFNEEKEGHIYSRYANPNVEELLKKMCALENAEAGWATATGMAAVFSTLAALVSQGDHIVSSKSVFGSTHKLLTDILPKFGVQVSFVDQKDYEGYADAINEKTKLVYVETPSNPGLDLVDLRRLATICNSKNVLFVVDNCFATPVIQKPLDLGAAISIHSATKYLDGQGRTMGGIILSSKEIIEKIKAFARHTGPAMSPFNAWVISKSLETLFIRVERHAQSAFEISKRLEAHPAVELVKYPFLTSHPDYEVAIEQMKYGGGIVSFEVKGGVEAGKRFLNQVQLFSLSANLGDTRSIATHPASTTHSKLTPEQRAEAGISDGLIRLSIGLEHIEDIWEDILVGLQST